ncbi:MAG TPA: 3-isopropylmalate dehydrogenase, partial [Pyrinomonadaceae bacterium]|nr:3-isopropylmalate dehydrogenase [Pyrinomonadaceae bacterium]
KIAVLPGDGVGPEVTEQAVRVLRVVADACGHEFEFTEAAVGGAAIELTGSPLPTRTLDACLDADAVLLGAVGAPLRPEVVAGADVLIVRELLGGLYFGEPRGFGGEGEGAAAFNTMRYTVGEIERVARVAFESATARRGLVTSVDKANVLETSRLWRETVTRVAREYPSVQLEHVYVDACAMHLVTNPRRFDVILTENLFGDILSDEAAVLAGSLGMLASASVGGPVDLYEPVHGSAPDIAGRGVANPLGAIASAALLLRHTAGLEQEAREIEEAITRTLEAGYRTPDLRDDEGRFTVGTSEMGSLVAEHAAELADLRHAYHAV